MKQKYRKKPEQENIAKERIIKLFEQALERVELAKRKDSEKNLKLAQRYVTLAKKISLKYKTGLPRKYKKLVCKHCTSLLIPGSTCRVRLRNSMVVYYCLSCKKFMRFPYRMERNNSRTIKS